MLDLVKIPDEMVMRMTALQRAAWIQILEQQGNLIDQTITLIEQVAENRIPRSCQHKSKL